MSDPGRVLAGLQSAANELALTTAPTFTQNDGVVSAARDIAQANVVKTGGPNSTTSPLIANADDALLNTHPDTAVQLLSQAAGDITAPTTTATVAPPSPDGSNGWYVTAPHGHADRDRRRRGRGVDPSTRSTAARPRPTRRRSRSPPTGRTRSSYWSTDTAGNVETPRLAHAEGRPHQPDLVGVDHAGRAERLVRVADGDADRRRRCRLGDRPHLVQDRRRGRPGTRTRARSAASRPATTSSSSSRPTSPAGWSRRSTSSRSRRTR